VAPRAPLRRPKRNLGERLKDFHMRTFLTLAVVVVVILVLIGLALPAV
jgi:hypothetical protein